MKQRTRIEIISVQPSCIALLMEKHGVAESSVYNALAFRSYSQKAEDIRRDALENFGGVKDKKVVYKEV